MVLIFKFQQSDWDGLDRTFYHTDKDDLENCDLDQLLESYEFLKKIVDVMENDYIPQRKYRGPLSILIDTA